MEHRLNEMQARLNADAYLRRVGRLFSETVLLRTADAELFLEFERGALDRIVAGPSAKTPWRFGLVTDADALAQFWQPRPAPGFHDIFGLVKIGRARIEGDILCLVKNLAYFKGFMALGREATQ